MSSSSSPALSRSQRLMVNRNKIKQNNLASSLQSLTKDQKLVRRSLELEERSVRVSSSREKSYGGGGGAGESMSGRSSPAGSPPGCRGGRRPPLHLNTTVSSSPAGSPATLRRSVLTRSPAPRAESPSFSGGSPRSGRRQRGTPQGSPRREPWRWEGEEQEERDDDAEEEHKHATPYSISCAMKVRDTKGGFESATGQEGLRAWMGRGSPKSSPRNSPMNRRRAIP